jgi:hypothetical protein
MEGYFRESIITHNVLRICAVADLELQIFKNR